MFLSYGLAKIGRGPSLAALREGSAKQSPKPISGESLALLTTTPSGRVAGYPDNQTPGATAESRSPAWPLPHGARDVLGDLRRVGADAA